MYVENYIGYIYVLPLPSFQANMMREGVPTSNQNYFLKSNVFTFFLNQAYHPQSALS